MHDTALCFQHMETVHDSSKMKDISCYSVFDLHKMEIVWRLDKVERLFFKAEEKQEGFIKFGEPDEQDDFSS